MNYYKQILLIVLKLTLLLFAIHSVKAENDNLIDISGYVTDNSGSSPVINHEVNIGIAGSGEISYKVLTDSSGFYSKAFVVNPTQNFILVFTHDCNNNVVSELISCQTGSHYNINFEICAPGKHHCEAGFDFVVNLDNPNLISFADTSKTKSIVVERIWNFGDGNYSSLSKPDHIYQNSGLYDVSLTIITSDSCMSTVVKAISINQNAMNFCHSNFFAFLDTATGLPNVFNFFTNASASSPITYYHWDFGDGITSSQANPVHQFINNNPYIDTFNVCHTIATLTGCTSTYCFTFHIPPGGSCNAYYSHAQAPGGPTHIAFTNQSQTQSSIAYLRWDFGEGSHSNSTNPTFAFPYPGYYNVRLEITTVDSCKSFYESIVKVGNPSYYTLFGQTFTGNYPLLDTGVAYLYRSYPNDFLLPVDTMYFGNLGCYYFFNLIEGEYKISVKPLPSSAFYSDVAPTYFSNEIHWSDAVNLVLNANRFNADVNLWRVYETIGQYSISGSVENSVSATSLYPLKDIAIMLFDPGRTLVKVGYTNADGEFSFAGLADGTYTIYAEAAGKYTMPVSVTLGPANPAQSGVLLLINDKSITGLAPTEKVANFRVQTFPNPAQSNLNIRVESEIAQKVYMQIIDMTGRVVKTAEFDVTGGISLERISLETLANSYYMIKLTSATTEENTYLRFIKSE